ncbi:MAG: 16S rRNA (adenine(1518)-N(6)/adenine(1519)-N(6))-dimethyltransferase RsmA [Chlorobi bacterium]|nr:16S rRNA (adenine(1518)-N(6)/adenine(1519)-N(6))-dimethyltransferase RsmA [Chlorobiota bacterium]
MRNTVKPKKYLGQHFLKDKNIAKKIVDSLQADNIEDVMEVGAGTGILTGFLLKKNIRLHVIEIDRESVEYLKSHFPELKDNLLNEDFLKFDLSGYFKNKIVAVTGNFPYNISGPVIFKIIEERSVVGEVVGMFQKEVSERITAGPGSKTYGILSVLVQAYFDTEYLFTVNENVFYPPPKVKSGVIRLKRKENKTLSCNEDFFMQIVKTSFNKRRKTLRNSLKSLTSGVNTDNKIFDRRPEQLSTDEFVYLTDLIYNEKV